MGHSSVLQEIVNMPVHFFLFSEVSIDSLMEVLLCRTNVDVVTLSEEESAQLADPNCPRTQQKYIQEISFGHSQIRLVGILRSRTRPVNHC